MTGFNVDKIDFDSLVPEAVTDEPVNAPLQSTMAEAVKVNPDSQVEFKKLSRESGMPVAAVETDPVSVKSSLDLGKINFDEMSKRSPDTAKYLTDYNNATIAHDDSDALSKLEDTLKIIPASIAQATLGISESIWRTPDLIDRYVGAAAQSIEDITGIPRNLDPIRGIQDIVGFISEGRIPGDIDLGLSGTTELAGMVSDATRKLTEQPEIFPEAFSRLAIKGQEADAALGDALKGDFTKITGVLTDPEAWAGFLGQAAPSLVLAYASGGSIPFISWLEAMDTAGGASEFEEMTGQKLTDAQFIQATTQAGLINAWFEKAGLDKILGSKGGGIAEIMKSTFTEGSTEAVQQFNSNFAQFIGFNRDQPLTEGLLASAMGGAGAGGVTSTAFVTTSKVLNSLERKNQRNQIQQNTEQNAIDNINVESSKSKLKERDKESFREFMQGVNEDSDVFIDGAQTALYLQTKTSEEIAEDPALQLLQAKADEAAALGSDLTIPVADFATDITGTETYDALRDHMKLSPETSTPFRQEQEQQEAKNYVDTLINEAQESASTYVESQDIFESVRDQLIDTGRMTPQQASVMADIVPAWATVQAQSRGIPVSQVYQESGLHIEGPMTGEAAKLSEQALEQAKTQGFEGEVKTEAIEWNRAVEKGLDMSQEVRVTRAKKMGFDTSQVLYHGTDIDISEFKPGLRTGEFGIYFAEDPDFAGEFTERREGGNIIPTYIKTENPLDISDIGPFVDENNIDGLIELFPTEMQSFVEESFKDLQETKVGDIFTFNVIENSQGLSDALKEGGIDEIIFEDWGAGAGETAHVIFDPKNIRSINAAFDPDFKESSQILAQTPITPAKSFQPSEVTTQSLPETTTDLLPSKAEKGEYYRASGAELQKYLDTHGDGFLYRVANVKGIKGAGAERTDGGHPDYRHRFKDNTPQKVITLATSLDDAKGHLEKVLDIAEQNDTIIYRILPEDISDEFAVEIPSFGQGEKRTESVYVHSPVEPNIHTSAELIYINGQFREEVLTDVGIDDSRRRLGQRRTEAGEARIAEEGVREEGAPLDRPRAGDIRRGRAEPVFEQPTVDQNGEAKGYYDPANSLIRLTESSDLSTFLHEFAHFMYDMELKNPGSQMTEKIHNWFKRNADDVAKEANGYVGKEGALEQPEIPTTTGDITAENVTAYLDTGTSGDAAKDSAIERAVHEQFARGFETYLMEGKAPSVELRNVFRSFARWLTQIYRAVRGDLNVNLDEEMRQVFARMVATEEQINAAEARAQFEPMFTDAAMAGMTDEEFQKYQERQAKAKDKASETLRDKLIKQLTRQTEKWWREEKSDIVDEEIERLKKEKIYVAKETLLTGEFKLDRPTVKAMAGEERTDKLGRTTTRIPEALRNMTAPGGEGVHPDEAAGFLGYNSGDELVQALIAAPTIRKIAEENAEAEMVERHGDIMNDGTIEKEADEAVQNEERGKLILDELKALSKDTGRAVIERQMLKAMAEENISKLSFRNIHPGKYRKAEIRAAQESAAALATGNKEEAATAKARQALNFYLGKAATEAKNDTIKIVDRMARYRKKSVREAIMKAGNGYWEQLTKVLNRFEFRKAATLTQVDKLNENINEWAKARIEEDGDALTLSPEVLDEGYITHWKNVPYDAILGINDSVKNLEHVARYSNKITRQQEEMTFQKLVQKWTDSMNEKVKTRFKSQRTDVTEGKKWGRWAMAQMTKIPYLASWLDGQERAGLSHDILVQPFTDAYNEELKLWDKTGTPVMQAIMNRSKEDLARHNTKRFIPAIQDADNDGNLFGHQILAVALNTGNESNLKKMLLGEGWANPEVEAEISFDNPKLQAVLKHMTESDWKLVQLIWDQMDQLYPDLAEVHRKTTGLTPPKVESTPIETEFGTFKGGYYPVKYDPNRSFRAEQNEDRLNAETESMFGGVGIQASVNASATNERTGYYAPIRLSLDIVPNHFQDTIHYITHHDAVRETNKLIRNESVAKTIKEKLGPEEYAQLKPWLNDIAKDGREAPLKSFIGSVLQRLRFGATLGIMGFKASTGLIQVLGISNTIAEVGSGPVYQATRSILGSTTTMQAALDFAMDNSKVLVHRLKTMDREAKNAFQKLEGKRGILAATQESSMKHILLIQLYMVDLPSWHAAYIKGMNDWGDEQRAYRYADWVIDNVQGSGAIMNMAQIMRDPNQGMKMFTMFMTFFSSLWNQERDIVKGAKAGTYSRTTIAAKLMFLFAVPVFLEMLMRGEFGDDDDDESNLQKYLTNTALYPIQSIPGLRDFASGTIGDYGYNISPIAQLLEGGANALKEIPTRVFTDEEITKGQVKGATKFIGAFGGVPGVNQAWATGEHLYDVMVEGEDLTLNELLYGPRRK